MLYDALSSTLFAGLQSYHELSTTLPQGILEAGLTSESPVSRDHFEKILVAAKNTPHLNRLLYLYDCGKLISGIQECTKEVCLLMGEFYRILNLEVSSSILEPDGVRWVTSPAVTNLTATLNMIYIRLHSLLDYIMKFMFEIEHLQDHFRTYPKLSSSGVVFADRRRTTWDQRPGTLFETGEPIDEIILVRNLVIHEGFLDDIPKAYVVIRGGNVVEKFVLMPDRTGPNWDRHKNRHLFYSREDKVNLRLPSLLETFQRKQITTLQLAHDRLQSIGKDRSK